MPSSRPGKIEAAVFCWIEPPEQPLPSVYLISPYVSTICSFIIISVSAFRTRFELKSESVRLLSATMKPRDKAVSSAQFRSEQNWADDTALSRGFMVADNSLTDSLFNSNRVLNAETLMMMKEHIVDTYGEIKYTLGNGCSGGSIQQNTAASIFPGLLDGIQPSCDYPDSITTGLEVTDCVLLVNFYAGAEWTALMAGKTQTQINAKKTAINGHLDQLGCQSWNNAFGFNNKPGIYARTLILAADTATGKLTTLVESRNNCLL